MYTSKKEETVVVSARGRYAVEGIVSSGYSVIKPYKDKNIIGRVLREIWFRARLPERIWYNKKILKVHPKNIIVQDTLITKKYLKWVIKKFPSADIYYTYYNMIGKAKHLKPDKIPDKISVWTYDEGDAHKYGINLQSSAGYFRLYIGEPQEKKYDVIFVGADKGRGESLLKLQKRMEQMGLKTKFIITADGRFSRHKWYYSKGIEYSQIISLDNQSKALLNITMPHQKGITMRDFESVFNKVKLITNNTHIINFDFYRKENVFILGKDDWKDLPFFLNTPFHEIDNNILEKYLFEKLVDEMNCGGL